MGVLMRYSVLGPDASRPIIDDLVSVVGALWYMERLFGFNIANKVSVEDDFDALLLASRAFVLCFALADTDLNDGNMTSWW